MDPLIENPFLDLVVELGVIAVGLWICWRVLRWLLSPGWPTQHLGTSIWVSDATAVAHDEFSPPSVPVRRRVSVGLRYDIFARDGYRCCYCGASRDDGVRLEVDHLTPVSLGGTDNPSNLATACADCNRGKGNRYDHGIDG